MVYSRFRHSGLLLAASIGAGTAAAAATVSAAAFAAEPVAVSAAPVIPVKVSAPNRDYAETPVSIVIPSADLAKKRGVPKNATPASCQSEPAGNGNVRLTWMVRDLKKGQSRVYALTPVTAAPPKNTGVEIRENGANRDIFVNGKLFTRYDTTTGPNKPYFYPLMGPGGKQMVRHWPLEKVDNETRDHPHHRGLWFTHGDVNGVDFWTEGAKAGKTVHTGYTPAQGGPVAGHIQMTTDWLTPDNKKIAQDTRNVTVYPLRDGCLMDFQIAVTAVNGPLTWGDTKEGMFGLRVPDEMRSDAGREKIGGTGHIVNSAGQTQDATWGKPAAWCDYYGPVGNDTLGIAIFDHPGNLRHPTTWHVRSYGLFAANPFGLHDFDPALKNNTEAGNVVTTENQTITFRYRLFLHRGSTDEAHVAEMFAAYADPPRVEVL